MTSVFQVNPNLLDELADDDDFQDGMQEVAEAALEDAQMHVPVDTGELRDSLHIEDGDDGAKMVVAETDHWLYVEFGTSVMEATPFLRPAIDDIGLEPGG